MPKYKTVIDWRTAEILYTGTDDMAAARALEPGTVIAYSEASLMLCKSSANERMNQQRARYSLPETTAHKPIKTADF